VEIRMALAWPREELSIPVARRVLTRALEVLGVTEDCAGELSVALSEACSNVVQHAGDNDEYTVTAGIEDGSCVLEVVDHGGGFPVELPAVVEDAAALGERGRGIQLMRALVDKVTFTNIPTVGTVVHLEKRLEWTDHAAIKLLSDGNPPTEHGPWSEPPPVG
jgi:serine/threonine-protein kinase RsbW